MGACVPVRQSYLAYRPQLTHLCSNQTDLLGPQNTMLPAASTFYMVFPGPQLSPHLAIPTQPSGQHHILRTALAIADPP